MIADMFQIVVITKHNEKYEVSNRMILNLERVIILSVLRNRSWSITLCFRMICYNMLSYKFYV